MTIQITQCPHIEKLHYAKGMCKSCYTLWKAKNNPTRITNCPHVDRPHHAKGMCSPCARRENKKVATCHPDRPHKANGLCKSCHNAEWQSKNRKGEKATCHPDRLAKESGLCFECHKLSFSNPPLYAECHPHRIHKANGLCSQCFHKFAIKNNSVKATCHPDKPHYANTLCENCYRKTLPPNSIKATCHPDKPHESNGYCKVCANKNRSLRKHNMTLEKYLFMWEAAKRSCENCRRPLQSGIEEGAVNHDIACVDHCHKTGRIRGILCHDCNKGLGCFRDDIDLLKRAISYLLR